MSWLTQLRRLALAIAPRETDFARRGFPPADPRRRRHLERMAASFVEGYNLALDAPDVPSATARLESIDELRRGFAYEGAAMALALLDAITPWNRGRVATLLAGTGGAHIYMVHVGAGWAAARLPWLRYNFSAYLRRFDPLLCWLAADGFGFHEGFFHWRRYLDQRCTSRRMRGYAARAFDQGLGRAAWFVDGAYVERVSERIAGFPVERQHDLWSGVGLAAAYAGGASHNEVERLALLCGEHRPAVAQGAAFAAKTRLRAGYLPEHTQMACEALAGMSAGAAAAITDKTLSDLVPDLPEHAAAPAYETWRRNIQSRLHSQDLSRQNSPAKC